MYLKLKYLSLLPIFAACLISSCSSDAPDNEENGKGAEVSFAVSNLTRASETTPFNKFAVYGDMKFPVDNNTAPIVIFNKTEVEYKNNAWYYDNTQYWFPKHEHSFVAISPLSVLGTDNAPLYSNSQLSFTYTIPTSANNKVSDKSDIADIIAATHRRLYDDKDANTTTTLKFGHIMSRINLAPALDDNIMAKEEYITITKFELSGFKTRASFAILPASRQSNSQTDDRVIDIYGLAQEGNLEIEFTEPVKIANDRKNVSIFDDNAAIIMLPQTFGADSNAKIVLYYTINNESLTKQITLPLMGQKWESGKSYNYKFTISRTGLHVDSTTITDWEMLNVGNINAR